MSEMKFSLAVLTGGKSKRFGSDKCAYKINGKTMTEMIVNSIGELFDEIIFVGLDPKIGFGKIVEDIHPDIGPVGGLESALLGSKYESIFLVACDMPFISPKAVKMVLDNKDSHSIVCPIVNEFYQVMHAIYSKSLLHLVQKEIEREKPSLTHIVLSAPDTLFLNESYFQRLRGYERSFYNFNFKEDIGIHNTENAF